jgi:Ca2+-binding RTX toxin-like protein
VVSATDPDGASVSDSFVLDVRAPKVVTGTARADRLDGSADDDRMSGRAGNDTLAGLDGDDTLDGGAGADRLLGGGGNDVYLVDSSRDVMVEAADAGIDEVQASLSWTLGDHVEHLQLTGSEDSKGTGNALDNSLRGNAADNKLDGREGNDRLAGGGGADTLTGGAGDDLFVFDTAPIGGRGNVDQITDFRVGSDHLVFDDAVFIAFAGLDALDAGMLRSGAGATRAQDADDHLLYDSSSGKLYYDVDGAGGAAAVQVAELSPHLRLTVSDVLIG